MDYEKKYKEALEKARKLYTYPTTKPFISELQDLFPELKESKESEDEIVIAALKSGINGLLKKEYHLKGIGGISFDRIIAWLEKQDEQKHVDKVKPKFKVGDWVVYENRVGLIIRILKEHYIISFDGVEEQVSFTFNDRITKWTIKDAKNGDVLEFVDHEKVVVGIVSFVNEKTGKVDVSCLLEDNKFKIGNFYALDTINPHPATKEQRDALMKAMSDAGYTFDFEKKNLKKIEQKSTAWSDYDECMLTNLIDDSNCSIDSEYIPWFKSLKDRVQSKL